MNFRYYLGVDGGGTNCRARLTDASGAVLAGAKGGPANINLEEGRVAHASILDVARRAFSEAGLPESALGETAAAMGLAGSEVGDALDRFMALPTPFKRAEVFSDGEIACLGAHGGADGGIVIMGTGTAACAVIDGESHRAGGWGFWMSDHGSGADIGRMAVRHAGKAVDGEPEMDDLARAVLAQHGSDPVRLAGWAKRAAPGDYGELAIMVFNAADAGQPAARAIIESAAAELARLTRIANRLGAARVSPIGSVALRLASDWIDPAVTSLVPAQEDALSGALMAARWCGLRKPG